jgi:hypothetical protein
LTENKDGLRFIIQFGWIFIIVRWFYYSILFQFRDYHGKWKPFIHPPFNLDLDNYAKLQRAFSLPFGLILMLILALTLYIYLEFINKKITPFVLINILGVTFFLPFLLVQPIDQLIIILVGWKLIPVTIIHTAVLLWESWASVEIISSIIELKVSEKLISITVLTIAWILITGVLWR